MIRNAGAMMRRTLEDAPQRGLLKVAREMSFVSAMAAALARGRSEIDCGCGVPPSPIGWSLVARNAILAAALVPAARGQAGWRGLDEAAAGWAIAAIALACWIAVEHLSANHHRMRRDQALLRDGLFGGPA